MNSELFNFYTRTILEMVKKKPSFIKMNAVNAIKSQPFFGYVFKKSATGTITIKLRRY